MSVKEAASGTRLRFPAPQRWPEPVDGADLLDEIVSWISQYIYLPAGGSVAMAVWSLVTWFIDELYFAPILALTSPTKRCGKSYVLHLIQHLVRRGNLTSGVGITSAVVFRLNDEFHPTFLIDEAEKLGNHKSGGEIISLLNAGHRRGQSVERCVGHDGDFRVHTYDAFGFRVIALIGQPWDTIADRSIIIRMERKPRGYAVKPFDGPTIDLEGTLFSRKISRWAKDNQALILSAVRNAPRPQWMNDREWDNWSASFAVAVIAGGSWPDLVEESARHLCASTGDDGDLHELLIRDLHAIFEARDFPDVIASGELAGLLGKIETSPWGDFRGGKGLSTHKLARLLRPFGVKPTQHRDSAGSTVRGYWMCDLNPVFDRYCGGADLGQVGQVPTSENVRPTAAPDAETRRGGGSSPTDEHVPVVPLIDPCATGLVFQLVQEG